MNDKDDEIKKAEQRGYSKGYNAGKRLADAHNARIVELEREVNSLKQSFIQRAFLAALPACIASQGWTAGKKPIINIDDKTALAWDFALAALKQRR